MTIKEKYPVIDKVSTGKRIKKFMVMSGYTVKEIRDYLGLGSVQSIYHWMEGKSLPSLDNLYALSVLLGVSMDAIVCSDCKAEIVSCTRYSSNRIDWYYEHLTLRMVS